MKEIRTDWSNWLPEEDHHTNMMVQARWLADGHDLEDCFDWVKKHRSLIESRLTSSPFKDEEIRYRNAVGILYEELGP